MKLLVYSHDAFGLGNIRRMLAVCQHLLGVIPNLSILVLSGSPALHSLRLPRGLDYIKLPCVSRNTKGELDVRFLGESLEVTMRLRSQLIRAAIANFQPDLFLVDKKPTGLEGELEPALADLKANHSQCKLVLLLRDILDAPKQQFPPGEKKDTTASSANGTTRSGLSVAPISSTCGKNINFPRLSRARSASAATFGAASARFPDARCDRSWGSTQKSRWHS